VAQFQEQTYARGVRCVSYPNNLENFLMRSKLLIGGLLASVMIIPALAQSNPPASAANPAPMSATTAPAPRAHSDVWRSSKLIGLNVYNDKNEKLGDINEILLDKSGKVEGVVIGVGGFLGMGEHDIKVDMSKLKFMDEPVRTSATTTTATTGEANRPATTTTTRSTEKQWYPNHAVLSGASKEQLKTMPQFKYN
jgi:sporulation protein YlmC with PRC-barrel domain